MTGGVVMDYNNYNNYAPGTRRPKIDNIFSALIYEKTPGAIMEFSLWCAVCVVVLMALIAAITGGGNVAWIFLMLFSAGMAVLMAFRLKPIVLLYGAGTMNLLMFVIVIVCFTFWSKDTSMIKYNIFNTLLIIALVILGIVLTVFAFIQFFTRNDFSSVLTILVIVHSSLTMFLNILMYACPFTGEYASDANSYARTTLNGRGYWIGILGYWMMLIVVGLYYGFFFWGCIDSRKAKIVNVYGAAAQQRPQQMPNTGFVPAIRGISGTYAGQMIQLQGSEVTIGSQQCHLVIHDPYVSARHCAVRFNTATGYYEVIDYSKNGVYLNNGNRLQPGVYNSLQRGSVIWLGSQNQQFQLM